MKSGTKLNKHILQKKLDMLGRLLGEADTFADLSPDNFANEMYLPYCEFNTIVSDYKKIAEAVKNDPEINNSKLKNQIDNLNAKLVELHVKLEEARQNKIKELGKQNAKQIAFLRDKIKEIKDLKAADAALYRLRTRSHDIMINFLNKEIELYQDEQNALLDAEIAYDPTHASLTSKFMRLFNLVTYQRDNFESTIQTTQNDIALAYGDICFSVANQFRVTLKAREKNTQLISRYIDKESALAESYKKFFKPQQATILNNKMSVLCTQRDALALFLKNIANDSATVHSAFRSLHDQIATLETGANDYFKHLEMFEIERRINSPVAKSISDAITILDNEITRNTALGYTDRINLLKPLHTDLSEKLAQYRALDLRAKYNLFYTSTPKQTDEKFKTDALKLVTKALDIKKVTAVCQDHKGTLSGWLYSLLFKIHTAIKATFAPNNYAPTLFATKGGTELTKVVNNIKNIRILN